MKKRRIILLISMWAAAFTLFTLSAMGASRPEGGGNHMTGSETEYQSAVPEQNESGEKAVRVSGCLSESGLAKLYSEALEGIVSDVYVTVKSGSMTVSGTLVADADSIIKKFPVLEKYSLILKLADGAPVEMDMNMSYTLDNGFSASVGRITVFDTQISGSELSEISESICKKMNERTVEVTPFAVTRWELLPGGLYYTAILPDTDSVKVLYPTI